MIARAAAPGAAVAAWWVEGGARRVEVAGVAHETAVSRPRRFDGEERGVQLGLEARPQAAVQVRLDVAPPPVRDPEERSEVAPVHVGKDEDVQVVGEGLHFTRFACPCPRHFDQGGRRNARLWSTRWLKVAVVEASKPPVAHLHFFDSLCLKKYVRQITKNERYQQHISVR